MVSTHPQKDQLIAFGQGKLAADEAAQVEQHLEVCRECCETLLDLKDDTFVGLVKVAKTTGENREREASLVGSGEITAQDTALKSGLSAHRTGYDSEQAATLLGSAAEDSVADELPPELVDHPRYRIVGLLGRGGMGNVYRAEHRLMSRPVAIKLINSNLVRNRMAVERFRREVQAAAKLSHPNIVAAYDAEQAGDVHFLVMEFVEGTDLASVVKQRGPMSVVEACECIQQAAAGLQHAHEIGMVHRDIKPHNLMMSRESRAESRESGTGGESSMSRLSTRDSRTLIRILDFGLAGFAEASAEEGEERGTATEHEAASETHASTHPAAAAAHLTTMGSVMGTPDYMAPEQAVDAHSADIRADIYALGCTLHFLLTGRPPFEREGVAAKLKAHASVSPPSLTEERSDVPLALSDIVARMMAKKPENRFQTPDEVVAVLEPFVRPPVKEPKRRLRTLVAALLMLLAGVIFVTTDKGRIEIQSEVDDVKVAVRQGGKEIDVVDVQTGSRVTWFPSGEYQVALKGNRNDVVIEDSNVTVTRWGRGIVTIKPRSDVAAAQSKTPPPMAVAPFNAEQAQQHQEAWAKHLGVPVEYTNSLGMKFRLIPPGEFTMGTGPEKTREYLDTSIDRRPWKLESLSQEGPQHRVRLTRPIYLGVHEVTRAQFQQFVESTGHKTDSEKAGGGWGEKAGQWVSDPSFVWNGKHNFEQSDEQPVLCLSWQDASAFCAWLSQLEAGEYSLPTEAQWEFACRAGHSGEFGFAEQSRLEDYGWFDKNSGGQTHPVGQKLASPFGLYDQLGNAWEWCADGYAAYLAAEVTQDPAPAVSQNLRAMRGGGYDCPDDVLRPAFRYGNRPNNGNFNFGFRAVLSVDAVRKADVPLPAVSDEQSLQGPWVAKTIKAGNGAMPAGTVPQWTMTFNNQSVQVTSPTGRNEGTFKLDVSKDPKEIDIEPTDGKGLIRGIYRFVGKELEVCIEDSDRKRPIQWDVDAGTRQMLIRFQRESAKPNFGRRPLAPNRFTRDQEAGEWITRVGATLRVNLGGVEKHVTKPSELPDGDWQVTESSLYPVRFDASVNLEKLSGLKSLRWLRLFNCNVSDANVQQLTDLPNLKFLDLDFNGVVSDASLAHIAQQFPHLEELFLQGSRVTDAGIASLASIKTLKRVNLSGTAMDGRGLVHLTSLPKLQWIALNESKVAVENLAHLEKCPVLDSLLLINSSLTDESVPQLLRLSKLKFLRLEGTRLSPAAIEQLRESMPKTSVQTVLTSQFPAELTRLAKNTQWDTLKSVSLNATEGAQLRQRDDGAIVAEGMNPNRASYKIAARSSLKKATALRLEALRDNDLPSHGPGRSANGTFVLTAMEVRFKSAPDAEEKVVPIGLVLADYTQGGNEIDRLPFGDGTWSIWRDGQPLQNQVLLMEFGRSLELTDESVFTITLKHESDWPGCNLGCFRLSVADAKVTSSSNPKSSQASQVLKRLEPNDELVTPGGVTREDGGWKIESDGPRSVILMDLVEPDVTEGGLRALATVKTQGLTAEARLQLIVGMSAQSPKFANIRAWPLNNQPDWSSLELAFPIAANKRPPWVQLAVTFKGAGTVWVKDVSLRRESPQVFATQSRQSPRIPLLADGINLLSDASFESSAVGSIPDGWERETTNDPQSRCEVVAGGRTDKQSLQVTVKQTRASVHSNSVPLDRTKRYTIKGWIKFEGDKDSRATFKLSYFQNAKMLEVRDVVSFAPDPSGWQRIETTDTLESIPAATRLLATCHVEGSGTAWFDDLELIAHNKDKVAVNLLTDPTFENTPLTQLPEGWRGWFNDGPEFRCEVVAGGHTGQRCLQISGKGTRGVVFANDLNADRSKRYALKGWVKFEGDKDARALIKLNYFRGGEFLGVHDLVGATADQPGWHLFEKTDTLDVYPTADHFYAMCHVEGSGTGWFDDLELMAYDRDKLPKDFDVRHGRHNRLHGPNSLHRWVGTWDTEYAFRETDNSPQETKLSMTTTSERTLGDYFLMSHSVADAASISKPTLVASATMGHERLQFLLFDQNLGAFRQWVFSSNGKVFEWRGPWNQEKQTLELRMLPDASNLHSSEHFVDDDHIETKLWLQYVMGQRDAGRWTATRKAFDGKVDVPMAKAHATEPVELSQLNKFAGEWTIRAKYKPSVWNPLPREETIRETSVWILGGRFLMTRAFNEKDELTSIWIATWEPREKSNRFWSFNTDGSSGEWRLTWDEATSGFQFRAVNTPAGWSGTGFNRWVNDDSFDNQALFKDENGRVLLDMTQERRRKK